MKLNDHFVSVRKGLGKSKIIQLWDERMLLYHNFNLEEVARLRDELQT